MFSMLVRLPVHPEHMDDVIGLVSSMMPRVREQEACRAFDVYVSGEPNTLWIYEAYDSEADHDVHESYPEVKHVLTRLPRYLAGDWTVLTLEPRLRR